jgi:hypothetical protein
MSNNQLIMINKNHQISDMRNKNIKRQKYVDIVKKHIYNHN